jgi:Tol biopolymer transport system component
MSPTRRTLASGVATLAAALVAGLLATPAAVATYPGDNGLILYQTQTDDGWQLFTMRPDGSEVTQLTHVEPQSGPHVPTPMGPDLPGAGRPDWSPDGRTIVFNVDDCQIALIDADGSDLREVPAEPGQTVGTGLCERDPSFTPDGQSIVYVRDDWLTQDVWSVGVDGTDRKLLTDICVVDPEVSPDGTRLSCKDRDGALWVVNLDGSGSLAVTPGLDVGLKHDWSPDGSAIVFSDSWHSDTPDAIDMATVGPDGTGLRYLTDEEPGSHAYIGSYSADGGSILYRVDRGDEHALFVMDADGSEAHPITEFGALSPGYVDWGAAPTE